MVKIGIIGTGNMGEAIIKGLLESDFKREEIIFTEISKDKVEYIKKTYGIEYFEDLNQIVGRSKYVIISVKPQDAQGLLKDLSFIVGDHNVIVSVMAGINIQTILSFLGNKAKIVRTMPNLCVKVKEGIIGMCKNEMVTQEEFEFLKKAFGFLGLVVEIKEDLFDAMTAFGGSGPAFFLFFLEGMVEAGINLGFSKEMAFEMAKKIIKGTLELLASENIHPVILRDKITSPGGTTISGIAELEEKAFKGAVIRAFEKALLRSKELSR